MQRGLRLGAPSNLDCSAITSLTSLCDEHGLHLSMMDKIEREHGLILALARLIVDERKSQKMGLVTREAIEEAAAKHGLLETTP